MSYRIEHDDSKKREAFGEYTCRIYDGDRLVARYWLDFRGDEHRIEFTDGRREDWPVGRVIDFVEGGGPEPLRLSALAQEYLRDRLRTR